MPCLSYFMVTSLARFSQFMMQLKKGDNQITSKSKYLSLVYLLKGSFFHKKNRFIPGYNINLVRNLFRRNEMVLREKKTVMIDNNRISSRLGMRPLLNSIFFIHEITVKIYFFMKIFADRQSAKVIITKKRANYLFLRPWTHFWLKHFSLIICNFFTSFI